MKLFLMCDILVCRDPMQLLVMSFVIEGFWGAPIQNISAKFLNAGDGYYGPELLFPTGYWGVLN